MNPIAMQLLNKLQNDPRIVNNPVKMGWINTLRNAAELL